MKAILIKHLSATNKLGSRLKAETEAMTLIEARNHLNPEDQSLLLAEKYIKKANWDNCKISGFGTLPNGDYVVTLESK